MRLKIKKIVAREFLMLIGVITIGIGTYLGTYPYNSRIKERDAVLLEKIESTKRKIDSLQFGRGEIEAEIIIDDNQIKILRDFDSKDGRQLTLPDLKKVINTTASRQAYFKEFNSKMGFKNYDEFVDLIQTDSSRKELNKNDTNHSKQIDTLEKELDKLNEARIKTQNSTFSKTEQFDISYAAIAISSLLLFILRYIIHGILWSIDTIRENDNSEQ